jgi:O-antigen/teichoic acid export membrane protein
VPQYRVQEWVGEPVLGRPITAQPHLVTAEVAEDPGTCQELLVAFCVSFVFSIVGFLIVVSSVRSLFGKAGAALGFAASCALTAVAGVVLVIQHVSWGYLLFVVCTVSAICFLYYGINYYKRAKALKCGDPYTIHVAQAPEDPSRMI